MCYIGIDYFTPLRDGFKSVFNGIRFVLCFSTVMMIVYISLLGEYLEKVQYGQQKYSLPVVIMPFLLALGSMVGLFIYLLPGMYDPENGLDRRIPFLFMLYFLAFASTSIFLSLNETEIPKANGLLIYGIFFFVFCVHLSIILFDLQQRKREFALVVVSLATLWTLI